MVDSIHIPYDVETNPVSLRNVLTLLVNRVNTISEGKKDHVRLSKLQSDLQDQLLISNINDVLQEIEDAVNTE